MQAKARDIGPYSRPVRLAKLDKRTREYVVLEATRSELIKHLGGEPSTTQLAIIERCGWINLHICMLDAKAADSGALSERDSRQYLAWSNSLVRTIRLLGIKGAAEKGPTIADHIARKSAEKAAREATQ